MQMIGLKEIRRKKNYSQLKVAMDLSISREALSYYENGKRSPDLEMLWKLSQYFNVSIDYGILIHNIMSIFHKLTKCIHCQTANPHENRTYNSANKWNPTKFNPIISN